MPPGIDMLLNSGIGRELRITRSVLASTSFCRSAASMRGVSFSCSTTSPNALLGTFTPVKTSQPASRQAFKPPFMTARSV